MKKVLQPLFLTVLAVPSFVFAAETASAPQTTTVDKVLAAKGPTSAQAVVKQENTKSQEKAKVALIGEAAVAGAAAVAANNVTTPAVPNSVTPANPASLN